MTKRNIFALLWAIAMPMAANAQHADSVRLEHEVELDEAVVTGLTGQTALKDIPSPVSLVSGKELSRAAATNIIDAVAQQPGMAQMTTDGGISKPMIRGLGFNRVVVVNDGIRQEGQQWGDEHGVEMDSQSVGSVEILKGPASLMYGSDALAGVLIMHSHPLPPPGSLQGSFSSEYHTNDGLVAYSMNASGNHGGLVWSSRWSQKLSHAYKDGDGDYVGGTQFGERAFTQLLGLNKRWGHSRLTLSYYHLTPSLVEEEGQAHGYGKAAPFQQIRHCKAVLDNSFYVGEGSVKVLVGYQQNRRQELEEADECGLHFLLHTVNYDIRYVSPTYGNGWKWVAGIGGMSQRSLNKGTEYLVPAYKLFDAGAFATATKEMDKWHFSGGIRYDLRNLTSNALEEDGTLRFEPFSRRLDGLTGSLGAVLSVNEHLNLRLNVARGFRAPNISELGSNGEHEGTGRYEVGNHDLRPEKSLQVDFGVDFSTPWLFLQTSVFANRITDYIFLERSEDLATYHYSSGDALLWGGEILLDIHPLSRLHFENTFSYVSATQQGKHGGERHLPFIPAPRWNSTLRYDIGRHAFASVGMEHDLAQNQAHTANGTETASPSYTLFNASAGTDIYCHGRTLATVTLVATNLTDRTYTSHLSRLKYMGEHGFANMGRNIALKLTVPIG